MMRFLFFAALFTAIYTNCYGQDTLYYKKNDVQKDIRVRSLKDAEYYDVILLNKEGHLQATRYKKKGNYKLYTSVVSGKDSMTLDGFCTFYNKQGKKWEEGNLSKGARQGEWKEYYPDTESLWVKRNYSNDTMTGKTYSYYETGELRREEVMFNSIPIGGKCYDKNGKEIQYFPLDEQANLKNGNIRQYIANSIKYPSKCIDSNIEGKVIVSFFVEDDGEVTELSIKQSVHPLLDAEATRVVKKSPKWKPAVRDGRPVRVFYMLPITFKLT
jgi:TonB family protein